MGINALIGDRLEVCMYMGLYGGEVGGRYRAAVAKVSCFVWAVGGGIGDGMGWDGGTARGWMGINNIGKGQEGWG